MHTHSHIQLIPRLPSQKGKTNIAALLFVILVGVGAIGAILIISKSQKITHDNIVATQPSLKARLDTIVKEDMPTPVYYMTYGGEAGIGDAPDTFMSYIFQSSDDPTVPDTLIASTPGHLTIYGAYEEHTSWLATKNGWDDTLYRFDAKKKTIEPLLKAPEGYHVAGAQRSHGKHAIAYAVQQNDDGNTTGEVYIYNETTKQTKKVFAREKIPVNTVIGLNAWSADDNAIVAHVRGGDGPGVWGEWFSVNLNDNNTVTPITIKAERAVRGMISLDGSYVAYSDCISQPSSRLDIPAECAEGEELVLLETATGATKTLYKNTDYENNESRAKLRIISSIDWKDRQTLLFSTPKGIYVMNIKERTPRLIHSFAWSDPDQIADSAMAVRAISDNHVDIRIYNHNLSQTPHYLLYLNTGKVVSTPTLSGGTSFEGFLK